MSKKLKDLQWQPVELQGFPLSMSDNFQGFVGLEECTDYGLEKESKKLKKKRQQKQGKTATEIVRKDVKKQQQKRKKSSETDNKEIPNKKIKLSNGFVVESTTSSVAPSNTNEISRDEQKPQKEGNKKKRKQKNKENAQSNKDTEVKNKKVNKPKLGEVTEKSALELTSEDMLMWSEFKLQEPLLRALTELGFKNPTKIQQLSLPAAIHGRRDILGAAETGSGKTLAFGLPILSGILKLKEKAAAKGLDVYDIPFRKTSAKKKNIPEDKDPQRNHKKNQNNKKEHKNNKTSNGVQHSKKEPEELNVKESSEDGYSSADDISTDDQSTVKEPVKKSKPVNKKKSDDNDYLEEIDLPIRKKDNSASEENESDEDNSIHLSEMLDSDDLADNSDEEEENDDKESDSDREENDSSEEDNEVIESDSENDENEEDSEEIEGESDDSEGDSADNEQESDNGNKTIDNEEESDENEAESDDNELGSDVEDNDDAEFGVEDQSDDESDVVLGAEEDEEINETGEGIGCVKVIDNIDIPGYVSIKTGKPLYALILTPTRELAMQISRHLIAAAKYTGIRVATIVGGMAAVKQERVLRCGPEVVVATPGRLWELVAHGDPHLQQLDSVKFLAIDETDRMIERGHFEELQPLLERLNVDEERKSARQNFVFSATLTLVHDLPTHMKGKKVTKRGKIINRRIEKMTSQQKIKRLVDMIGMTDPKVVDITADNLGTAETLTECRISCTLEHKDAYLYYIIKRHPGRTIVFCNSIGCVRRLAQLFTILKCHPLPLHASMPQRQRLKNLERFRDDPRGVLIATDVAARGLDIPDIDHVIQYQVPRTAENYVHRSGRTARANKEGINVLMVEPSDAYLYSKLCRTLNKTSEVPSFPVEAHLLTPLKEVVAAARQIDILELKRKRVAQAHGWREKAAREMDMIIDDDDVPVKSTDPSLEKALKSKRRQLESMLTRPMFPRGFSFKYPSLNDPTALTIGEDNALQVMKKSLESGELKKEKRKGKNATLLTLGNENKKMKYRNKKNKK